MSAESRIAVRYAKALISLSQEKGNLEKIKEDMDSFKATCADSRPLSTMLKNPIITTDKKYAILDATFQSQFDEMTMTFMQIICRRGRTEVLEVVADEVIREYNDIKGIQQAEVKTPFALDAQLKGEFEEVVKKLSGKSVALKEVVDPELLGGYVLTIGDRQIDDSVASSLNKLKVKMLS